MNDLLLKIIGCIIFVQFNINCDHLVTADESPQDNNGTKIERLPLNSTYSKNKLVLPIKRKSVLILNSGTGLRSRPNVKEVTSLLYQDFDLEGKLLNNVWMYDLKDVSEFFKVFLETEICYVQCRAPDLE